MKKRALILTIVLAVVLLFAMSSAVSADPAGFRAIKCDLDITYDDYGDGEYWLGTVSGDDCGVAGTIRFDSVGEEYFFPGNTMHFVENFTIWPGSDSQEGDSIEGKNCGVWNLTTFHYRAHGWVTKASGEWSDLEGAQYHENGVTDPFHGDPDEYPITAFGGTAKLVPGNRPVPEDGAGLCPPTQPGETQ